MQWAGAGQEYESEIAGIRNNQVRFVINSAEEPGDGWRDNRESAAHPHPYPTSRAVVCLKCSNKQSPAVMK